MHKLSEVLDKYCERVEKELRDLYTKISKAEILSPADLDSMDKLLHSLKSIKTTSAMVEHDERNDESNGERYSRHYESTDGYSGYRSTSGIGSGTVGRHSRDNDMIRKLEDMMTRVRNEDDALAIRDAIDIVNKLS